MLKQPGEVKKGRVTMKYFDVFRLDIPNECLWKSDKQIPIPPKPYAVLRYLVEHPGRLVTHDELLEALWPETYVQPQVLRTYMLDLRKALGDDAGQPRFIQTLPKRGYCFVAPVIDGEADQHASFSSFPPAADAGTNTKDLVGRDEEQLRLAAQAEQAAQGQRRLVFISGEAGIGKSALVDAFCRQVSRSLPLSVACGQCIEGFAAKEEYYPVMEALSQLCASPDGQRACRVLAEMAPAWLASSMRETGRAASSVQSVVAPRMPGDVCAALEELASEKPLVLIFEDLHWADEATLHLISALARRRATAKLLVLATFRPHDGTTEHPLRSLEQDLFMRKLCIEIALQPLAKTAIQKLLRNELKQEELPAGLSSFVHQHSEGNPLFAIAILEHLIAQRFLVCEGAEADTRWKQGAPFQQLEAVVPHGPAQMIELEINRLPAREQRMLEAASLVNIASPAWAVAAALDEDAAEIEEACDDLTRRLYFFRRGGEDELPDGARSAFYVFAHGLYREVLYQRQSARCREKRHTRIAERLGALFSGREAHVAREMAVHYEAAANWPRAVHALRAAAQHARQRRAFAEAADLLEHTLRLTENLGESECEAATREIHNELSLAREAHTKA